MFRSVIFTAAYILWTGTVSVLGMVLLPFPQIIAIKWAHFWAHGVKLMMRLIAGITYRVEGDENFPKDQSCIIASKHQSAFETIVFHLIFPRAAFVLKKELLYLPFFGWQLMMAGSIAIDRSSGAKAMRSLLDGVNDRAARLRQIIIFPEGTRTEYGRKVEAYHPGIALLYGKTNLPVIPVALNSGKYWGRNSIMKKPGLIKIKIMPEIPRSLDKKAFLQQLNQTIETACEDL